MRLTLASFGVLILAGPVLANTEPARAGQVVAEQDGRRIELPLLRSDLAVNIEGDMATVQVTQTFENPSDVPLNAEYLFPLNSRAAVYAMEMRIGEEVIRAVIREKAEAEAEYEAAKDAGKGAALLTQHRPNMFTQEIANLMPGQPVEVRLAYVQRVTKAEGAYELVVPLVVGPRYEGGAQVEEAPNAAPGQWQVAAVPEYPGVAGLDLPQTVVGDRVTLDLTLAPGLPLAEFGSDTHPLDVTREDGRLAARFAKGAVLDNRDLVLRYTLEGEEVQAAALSHSDARGGFLSLMLEPPQAPKAGQVTPRELVFVLDTSGSMRGAPLQAAKRFMSAALDGLRPEDHFRIIPFANEARHMSQTALPADPQSLAAARRFVQELSSGGGTEIDSALKSAFGTRQPEGSLRIVVFLSDGYIGDEAQVLRTLRAQIGQARVYAFGVGSSVNRYLLDAMAEEGRGRTRYVGIDETALEVAEALARDLAAPVLTDIEVDWGDLAVTGVSPARVPDLFAGQALRVYARHSADGPATLRVSGLVNGRPASIEVPVQLTGDTTEPALPLIWARSRIADLERNVALGIDPAESDAEITQLGLEFSLQTKNTSFVAVSKRPVNETGLAAQEARVPVPMVHGVQPTAYPKSGFAGSSTPEPEAIWAMLLLAGLSLVGLRMRGRLSLAWQL